MTNDNGKLPGWWLSALIALLGAVGTAAGFKVGTSVMIENLTRQVERHSALESHYGTSVRLNLLEHDRAVANDRWARQMEANTSVQQKLDVLLTRLGKEGR